MRTTSRQRRAAAERPRRRRGELDRHLAEIERIRRANHRRLGRMVLTGS